MNLFILNFSFNRYVIEKSIMKEENPTMPNFINTENIAFIFNSNDFY